MTRDPPADPPGLRTGGQVLVAALQRHGVDTAFCVPGESYLAVLDALYDATGIRLISCRQEGGAAYMAEAYGKLTGRPGICLVTRGPGACNASPGLHTAYQSSTPLILLVGQVPRAFLGREAFQEIDYRRMFGEVAKRIEQVEDPARLPEAFAEAYHAAMTGRPGPVVIVLPEDVLSERAAAADIEPLPLPCPAPSAEELDRLARFLEEAARPLILAGDSGWTAEAAREIAAFSERTGIPVANSYRSQDIFDNRHPHYAGSVGLGMSPKLRKRVEESDLLVVIGARLDEITTDGYRVIAAPVPRQKLVHVYPGRDEIGRVFRAALGICATPVTAVAALRSGIWPSKEGWRRAAIEAHREYEDFLETAPVPGQVDMAAVMRHLRRTLPDDVIVTNGAGNYTAWPQRFLQFSRFRSHLAPLNGSMGYGVPAAVAAQVVHPGRRVVSFAGDGCFLMNGQELATAMKYELAPVYLVINNGIYGTIRMHQERHHPGRVIGTGLHNPDFAAYARAFGAHGETVLRTEEFPAAFDRAWTAGKAAVIDIHIDPEVITPATTLSEIRRSAQARA